MILMTLGWFAFSLPTAAYETLQRNSKERWASNNRMGQRPAYQHLGPGEDTMTLDGVLFPEVTGGRSNLVKLRDMKTEGKAWILISGQGEVMGTWFIESIDETQSHFLSDGQARKIEYSLKLKLYDDSDTAQLGNLPNSLVNLARKTLS